MPKGARKIGENVTYWGEIIHRFMDEAQFKRFHEEYINARYKEARRLRPVTEKDKMMLIEHLNGMSNKQIALKHRTSYSKVTTAIRYAALDRLTNQ